MRPQPLTSAQDVFKEFGEIVSCKVVGEENLAEESKTQESNQGYGFVCFKNSQDARQALLRFMESPAEAKTDKAPAVAGTGEQLSYDDEEAEDKEKAGPKLYVAPHMKKEFRQHFLKLKTLRFKRTMARHNLYFRGFPVSKDVEGLKQQLTEYFAQFGEVNNLVLISRKKSSEDVVGFGFVSFKTLEGAQTAKYQA